MGLIKAGMGSVTSALADQWKEFFYCESLESDVLVTKGVKRVSDRSSNTKGSDNLISSGSGIAVADGQCMVLVEQGKIVEVCAEPGLFTFDASTEPSVFTGDLQDSVKETFMNMWRRFSFGGDTGKDQRIYYINTKEILDNKYGTQNPVPFRVVDRNIGLDVDIAIRCNGVYSYKIVDPVTFYTNVTGNVESEYTRGQIDQQLKSELLTSLQPAFSKISEMGIRYSALPGHAVELSDALNEILSKKWTELRGIKIVSFAVNSIVANKEDEDMIKQLQKSAVMKDPTMAAASIVGAQADAMRMAASNESGAMMGFMGLNMAQQSGGLNAQNLYNMGAQQQQQQQADVDSWNCSCGNVATGKFCTECGSKKPESAGNWTCPSCNISNTGNFCSECGLKKPSIECSKCGWKPNDPQQAPKFCPECGNKL